MDCGVKLILCMVHLSEKLENRGSLLLRIYPVCLGLPGHTELTQELRVSHCAGDGGGCGSFVSMNALIVWCLCSDSISHFCRVLQVGLDPWLSWHCCVLSAGLKDGMILLYCSSKTPENFSYVEKSKFGSGVTTDFFLLSFTATPMACPELSGERSHCQLWAEESQHVQPGPALLVPRATPLYLYSDTAAIAALWTGPPQSQEEGCSLEVASFASEKYYLLLKAVEIRSVEKG